MSVPNPSTSAREKYGLFLFKSALFLAVVFLLDLLIGSALRHYYFKQESGMLYRTTYSMEKTSAETLVFGSSRANHHYEPSVFENRLGRSYYNVGRDGNNILYHYAVLKSVLNRYTPKIIILDLTSAEFRKNTNNYDRLSALLPYYKTHPEIRPIVELKSRYEKLKLASSIYPFNSLIFSIAVGNTEYNKNRRGDIKGYVPLTRTWTGKQGYYDNSKSYEIDTTLVNAYESFIRETKKSGARLFIVCSPSYVKSNLPDSSIQLGKEIARKNQIAFLDFTEDPFFLNAPALFSDLIHLNERGAAIFSAKLIDKLMVLDRPFFEQQILKPETVQ